MEKGVYFNTMFLLPGSFHTIEGNKTYNLSSVTNGAGKPLVNVYKMNKFKIIKSNKHTGSLLEFINHDGIEKIAFDKREITLFETPIGRIAIFICVDLLNFNIEEVLIDRHVDIVFVMTMTERPASGKFLRRMQELGERNHTTIFICNNLGIDKIVNLDDPCKEKFRGDFRIVAYFPGLNKPYRCNDRYKVISIEKMIEAIRNQ